MAPAAGMQNLLDVVFTGEVAAMSMHTSALWLGILVLRFMQGMSNSPGETS